MAEYRPEMLQYYDCVTGYYDAREIKTKVPWNMSDAIIMVSDENIKLHTKDELIAQTKWPVRTFGFQLAIPIVFGYDR